MMNTAARRARENAISFEVKKDGLQQRQSGDWVLRLTVQAVDMHQRIVSAAMGTRFACVLVEVNDDETPVDHKAMDRDKWRDLGATRQAGIRCKQPLFWVFLSEEKQLNAGDEEQAAGFVRAICGIQTRSDLDKPGYTAARARWHDLDFAFQAWKALEHG